MEMDSAEVNRQVDFNEYKYGEPSLYVKPSAICDVFGDHQVLPRVGNEYQVEIPPLPAACNFFGVIDNPTNAKFSSVHPYDLLMGLPIPVMRIYDEVLSKEHNPGIAFDVAADVTNRKGSLKSKRIRQLICDNLKLSAQSTDIQSDHGMISGKSVKLACKQKMMSELHEKHNMRRYSLVPGSSSNNWSDTEEDSFVLGLYIFGKNLVQVKKFVGSKHMGDILSFYYGKFYRSYRYKRWIECKQMRTKRGKIGVELFTGLRQEVLLSRLLPHMSEEDQTTVLEVFSSYQIS